MSVQTTEQLLTPAAAGAGDKPLVSPITTHMLDTALGRPAQGDVAAELLCYLWLGRPVRRLCVYGWSWALMSSQTNLLVPSTRAQASRMPQSVTPACTAGVPVQLLRLQPGSSAVWELLASGATNADGRVPDLLPPAAEIPAGTYRCCSALLLSCKRAAQLCSPGQI